MALKLIKTVAPCFNYEAYSGGAGGRYVYHPELITPPRQYVETISYLKQFFYDPVEDVYVAYASLLYAFYPSWRMYRMVWNAVDGSVREDYVTTQVGFLFSHWTNQISVGGYNKFYATGGAFLDIKEVDWKNNEWTGWTCYDWAGRYPPAFSSAIVNRADKIVAGVSSHITIWLYNYETHALLGKIGVTGSSLSLTYESDTHLWSVDTKTGQLAKINYQTRRHELLTRVQDPEPEDLSYACAFDTNRKRLAILRHKPDAADGACRLQLEFYQPVPQPKIITAPVPVKSLTAGGRITFSAHVLGDAGEGIASQAVTAVLEDPAAGQLVAGRLLTGQNGGVDIDYVAPADNAAETLTIATEV